MNALERMLENYKDIGDTEKCGWRSHPTFGELRTVGKYIKKLEEAISTYCNNKCENRGNGTRCSFYDMCPLGFYWYDIHNVTISDGFGSSWSIICPECGQPTMVIVRPGKVQCTECE